MAYKTGMRLLAVACFLIGGLTIIGAPLLWPVGWLILKKAWEEEEKAEERHQSATS